MKIKKILGTMRLPATQIEIKEWLKTAHKAGYEWLDLAYVYGGQDKNAKTIAPVLKELEKEGISFKLQSKIWTTCFPETRKYLEIQLKDMGISKYDAMLLHRPSINLFESIEAWKELIKAKQEGLVDEIGVSNFENDMIRLLEIYTKTTPQINQIEHSVTYYRPDRIKFCKERKIEIQGWSSFGANILKNLENEIVQEVAKHHSATPSQVLLAFSTSLGIAPVIGTINLHNLIKNLEIIKLSDKEIKQLSELNVFENKFEETFPLPAE